jgi:hypothetical protein
MLKDSQGNNVLEIDQRLVNLAQRDKELRVTEEEFFEAIKAYKLDEALEQLAIISKRIFGDEFPEEFHRMGSGRGGVQHPCGIYITQFAIEYLAAAFILSGSNNWKSESIKSKDNLLGLFNIYHNTLVQKMSDPTDITTLLVPMTFQQFVSQADARNVFARQWYIFHKIYSRLEEDAFENLNSIFLKEVGLSMLEYTKLGFTIFATILAMPRFNIGELGATVMPGLNDVFNEEKVGIFLNHVSATYDDFRKLDKEINRDLDPIYTKTRFNPLWQKPIVRLGTNDYLVPSTSAYITATFKGLFWWFDTYFYSQSRDKGDKFRTYFGSLFEEYIGDVLKDIYREEHVKPAISYGSKKAGGEFFDWIVETPSKILLFEAKGSQFPLNVLQKGDPESIRNEVVSKIVKAIKQTYKQVKNIEAYEELKHLRGKEVVPIAVFYDVPLVSTPMYDASIQRELDTLESSYPGIKDFQCLRLSMEELESYYYASNIIDIDTPLRTANTDPRTGFKAEIFKNMDDSLIRKGKLLDRAWDEYWNDVIGVPESL